MSCDYEEAMPKASSTIFRKARKEHKCCACKETIRKGDRYRVESGVWEHGPKAFKYCARCSEIIEHLTSMPNSEGFLHGFKCEHTWEDPPEEVAKLAFVTRDEAQQLPSITQKSRI